MKKSLWITIGVLVVVLGVAAYMGILSPSSTQAPQTPIAVAPSEPVDLIPGVASVLYTNTADGFLMYRPATAESKVVGFEGYLPLTQTPVVAFTLPNDLFAKTNLGEAGVYVGATTSPVIVATCTSPSTAAGEVASTSRTFGGYTYGVFTSNDAGTGNYYDRTAYRTVHNNICFELVEVLHSSQLGNFPAGTVTAFDRPTFSGYLDAIVNTFSFNTPAAN